MEENRTAVLDLGGGKIVCLAVEEAPDGRLHAEAFASVASRGISKGRIMDEELAAGAVMAAIQRVEKELGAPLNRFCVNLDGSHIQASSAQGFVPLHPSNRPVKYEDVLSVLKHSRQVKLEPDQEIVCSVPREYHVDGQRGIVSPLGLIGSRLEVVTTLVTASTREMTTAENLLMRCGKSVAAFVPGPMASALGAGSLEQLESGCLVIDLGKDLTHLAIYVDRSPVLCLSLPVGSWHVTNDVRILLKTDEDEAERVKVEHGSAAASLVAEADVVHVIQSGSAGPRPLKRRALAEIIEARVREIAGMAAKELQKTGMKGRLPGGVILCGGGANLDGIETVFGEAFAGAKVRVGSPKTTGDNSRRLMQPQYAASVGIARYVMEGDRQEFEPVSAAKGWKDNIRTIQSLFGRRS
jgi:cell division protein FtsA